MGRKPKDTAPSVRRLSLQRRRALELLAGLGQSGATETIMQAHGFTIRLLAGMVRDSLLTSAVGEVRAGGRMVEVRRFQITAAGRKALEG